MANGESYEDAMAQVKTQMEAQHEIAEALSLSKHANVVTMERIKMSGSPELSIEDASDDTPQDEEIGAIMISPVADQYADPLTRVETRMRSARPDIALAQSRIHQYLSCTPT